jgi:hypothetical protein
MNCEDAREARLDRASGPLGAERERELAAHMGGCTECRTFAAEIDAIESGLEETLAEVASVSVARRFRPRSRWAPLAAAAACVVAAGLGWHFALRPAGAGAVLEGPGTFGLERAQVALGKASRARVEEARRLRLERGSATLHVEPGPFEVKTDAASIEVLGTDFTVELREDPMKRTLGASVVVVGVVSGVVLLKMNDGRETTVHAGETAVGTTVSPVVVLDPVAEARKRVEAEKKVAALETELARSATRVASLETELARVTSAATALTPAPTGGAEVAHASPDTPDAKVKEIISKFDWKSGTRALVQVLKAQENGTNEPFDQSLYVTLSKMNVVAAEIATARGYANPWQAYSDPAVRETFVPAWLDALGANLDDAQVAAVQQHVRDGSSSADAPSSYLGALKDKLERNVDYDKFLAGLLRPDQLQTYNDTVGDNPFFGSQLSLSKNRGTTLDSLAQTASDYWQKTFDLSATTVAAAQTLARQYAEQASAIPPVDPSLDVTARRAAATQRAIAVIALQQQMEQALAAIPGLTPAEQARVQQGSRTVLDLQLNK